MTRNIFLVLAGFAVCALIYTANLSAEDITATGWSQRAVVKFLTNVVTMGNEVKADHNSLITTHNAVFASYTGLRYCLINYTSASTIRTQGSARALPSGASSATTSTTDLTLSGL